jgi:hypothetical protein
MTRNPLSFALCSIALAAACTDAVPPTTPADVSPADHRGTLALSRSPETFVSIGTSLSMGWASNGVFDLSQLVSWPALLEFGSGHPISLPLIRSPGCQSPLLVPLALGKRLSGESAAGSTVCAPNDAGVTLPTQNVAVAGALAVDALATTSEAGAAKFPWYARVLPPGTTQLTAALAQRPTFAAVELGANEVLNATSGLVVPGVTIAVLPQFAVPYDALLDALGAAGVRALLFSLPTEARNFPALRRGDEIWADRLEFAALHVTVSGDCETSQNYINVAVASPNIVFVAAANAALGLPNPVFSCSDIPGTMDLVLTPTDLALVNNLLAEMNAHIQQQAAARGYALASLGALYDQPSAKPATYSVVTQLTSLFPYGVLFSADGVHPSAFGNAVLAAAAARGINATYAPAMSGALVRVAPPSMVSLEREAPSQTMTAGSLLERAQRVALEHPGMQLSPCLIPGACNVKAGMR